MPEPPEDLTAIAATTATEPAVLIVSRARPRLFKAPLAALAANFALGILWAHAFPSRAEPYWPLPVAVTCILFGLLLLRAGWGRGAVCLALASMTFTGLAATERRERRFPLAHVRYLEPRGADLSDPVQLTGTVVSTPYRGGSAWQFDLAAKRVESGARVYPAAGKIRLRVQGTDERGILSDTGIQVGDVIQVTARLYRPHVYQNPGSFDFRRWMEDIEDIYWMGTVRNPRAVETIGHAPGYQFRKCVASVRQRLLRGIDDLYPPWSTQGRYGAVLKAVLWGDRTALDSATVEDFRRTGLYHLLVIAGLHVGLLTLLVESLLRAVRCRRMTRAAVVLGFLAIYAALVEQRAPTLRATLMIGLYLVARLIDREHSPLNAIGGVALLLLYFRPGWLFESGFQLSFSAALLIVCVVVPILARTTEPYRRALLRLDDVLLDDRYPPRLAQARLDMRAVVWALRRRGGLWERFPALARHVVVAPMRLAVWIANIVLFSAVLQLGLLLPMVETFHRVTFAGVGLNALAIPVMTVLLALALPINLLSAASPALAVFPARLLTLVMNVLFRLAHLPAGVVWLSYREPAPPAWVACGFAASFVLAGVVLWKYPPSRYPDRPRRARPLLPVAFAVCFVFVCLVAAHPFAPRLPKGELEMTALEGGEAQAWFLSLPSKTTLLLFAAGHTRTRETTAPLRHWDPGEEVVSPFLWSRGIKRIDVLVLAEAGPDQMDGLSTLLTNFQVGEFWGPPQTESLEYAALLDRLAQRHVPTRTLLAGDVVHLGDDSIRVLWPPALSPAPGDASADQPLVLRLSSMGADFLVAGEWSDDAETGILRAGAPLASAALVLARHGALSLGTDFLARVHPRWVVFNSEGGGEGRRSWRTAASQTASIPDSTVLSTDRDGAVTMRWDGRSLRARSFGSARDVAWPSRP